MEERELQSTEFPKKVKRGMGEAVQRLIQCKKEEKWKAQTWKTIQIIHHKLDQLLNQEKYISQYKELHMKHENRESGR